MVLNEWAYRAKHIPGSLHISTPEQGQDMLDPDDEIVIYCTNTTFPASIMAYQVLKGQGFKHLRRYAGGLDDWKEARYALEGEMVGS